MHLIPVVFFPFGEFFTLALRGEKKSSRRLMFVSSRFIRGVIMGCQILQLSISN